jgi:signal transduction histidine kinase
VERYCGSLRLILPDGAVLPHEQSPMREVLRTGVSAFNVEVSIERPDGSLLPVLANFAAMKDAGGHSTGVVTTFVDVSHHARALRTLTDSERRKDEFLATLAHELHNPLAPIRYAVQILRQAADNGAVVRQTSAVIERQVDQLVSLVDDLLDVSRLSLGKIDLRRQRLDLVLATRHAVEAVHAPSRCSEHQLRLSLPAEPIYLEADPTRLAQILGNVLGNACKFTEKGGEITVAVELDGAEAVIRVGDSGLGIEAAQLEDIFIMFMQVDCTPERAGSGLGVGLSLARTLVELHGGSISAQSAGLGRGSLFTVRLPLAK